MTGDFFSHVYQLHPHACLYIDASFTEIIKAYGAVISSQDRDKAVASIRTLVHPQSIVALSARTAFDLWLRVNKFPKGSELLLTAVNIPDMIKVIRESGLIPVPVDIAFDTLFPTAEAVRAAVTPKTVGILVAQLYGRRNDISEIAKVAQELRLPLIEDLAEGWAGGYTPLGAMADLTLFSFGPIKFNTAFGGGIGVVKDAKLFKEMDAFHNQYNIRSKYEMLSKLVKYMIPLLLLNVPMLSGFLMRVCTTLGIDHKAYVVAMLRGFPDHFFEKLRHRPDAALLTILENRIATYDKADAAKSAETGELLTKVLRDAEAQLIKDEAKFVAAGTEQSGPVLIVPGQACTLKNYWLYPLLVDDPVKTMAELNRAGIDSYRGATQLNLVDRPVEYKDKLQSPPIAKRIMDHTIYIPVHKGVSANLVTKMGKNIAAIARKVNKKPVFSHLNNLSISNSPKSASDLPRGQLPSKI